MASHVDHESLPGYDERQIWHDGCDECEYRSANLPSTLTSLDSTSFRVAWARATAFNIHPALRSEPGAMSNAERPLLDLLWSMQLVFERDFHLPIGALPYGF